METFGLAGLEALACGTPVVVNAASALPEVVGPGGIAADGTPATFAERFGWPAAVAGFLRAHGAHADR